ncbi:hypothetical protein C672_1700 [[Clostridium] bifermentans ATCC 638]|uniref:Uncharacterized protein n=1 Tax=Paraclostridium bifermentans ATCC 638 = DSM 14991 TaxID=1233171 RepID=T4VPR9_PARBF|nr:hypothetical protein [Paraclostridium bifermentans]EQK42756.1 hypothetical protein C672_1700 [[Clostridium] bifermentans ATCC 638] [Paraclostridium bifermentans ATCC 638 = DSM 14991]RIZ58436.1 hypothetical protein CHH45_11460 [Paraclostridium bifermentans]UAG19555.1 hypothetical protein KXZ80_07550 [Paraclostridium bifermentans]
MRVKKENMNSEEKKICDTIKGILEENMYNYCQVDIDKHKKQIIEEIEFSKVNTYYSKNIMSNQQFIVEGELRTQTLDELVNYIKDRYIYEDALMQLVNESKLIPILCQRPGSCFSNGADIELDFKYGNASSSYIYIYLDLLVFTGFRVSKAK